MNDKVSKSKLINIMIYNHIKRTCFENLKEERGEELLVELQTGSLERVKKKKNGERKAQESDLDKT